ncbi:MAG: HAMP domain-containing protein [Deltaproteobacteria bacterium]|nr:HAMP domain-containing protein [Deltaproteobacteria bacterium]
MARGNAMMRFSISSKLLLFILPLVCLPIAIVGYFSIHAAVERVNRLVRHEQMVEVKTTAKQINDVLYYCRLDLETISRLPVLEDYHIAKMFRLEAEAEFNYENIVRLFNDFIGRTSYYYQIRYLDNQGREQVCVRRGATVAGPPPMPDETIVRIARSSKEDEISFSDVFHSPERRRHFLHGVKAYRTGWGESAGIVVIDLDFEKIIDIVKAIHVGEKGYAFLIDQSGRNIAHPQFQPYRYHLENYPDLSLRELVMEMMKGGTGWRPYLFEGEEKVAAFSSIPVLQWSLAVTIPTVELTREAKAIQTRVIEVVLGALVFAVIGVSVLSYTLLRPVRNLVTATNRIAGGDLSQEIPVGSRDELGDLTRSFNRMVKNLSKIQNELIRSEKLISLGRLTAGVAHEVRNPLNAMKGAVVYMQRRRPGDSLVQEYTQLVSEEIDRLNRVVTEFLYLAKEANPALVPTDLNKLILATQSLLATDAKEKGISFRNRLEPSLPTIHIDPQQIEQVLVNLVINAMDAMPEGGELRIGSALRKGAKAQKANGFVQVTLADTGIGISSENLQSIFDPFFSTKEAGTGIGLPLSLGIVEAHGGTIRVRSQENKGTTVIIELPLTRDGKEEHEDEKNEKGPGR